MMERTLKVIEVLSHLVVSLGVIFFLVEFLDERHYRQKERTLRYVEIFQSGRMADAREALQKPWTRYNLESLVEAQIDKSTFEKLVLEEIKKSPPLQRGIFAILDHYESLRICVSEELCDEDIAKKYYKNYGTKFNCIYGGYTQALFEENNLEGFDVGIKFFSNPRELCF